MAGHGLHAHPTPDVSIDYFAAGEGKSLVLVHGITESRRTWDPLIAPFIAAGYRVVAVDLRGHGASSSLAPYDLATMAGDVGAVVAAEQLTDPLMVGHSLGGAVVSAYAAGGPCRGVINVDQPLALSEFQAVLAQLEPMLRGTEDEFRGAIQTIFDGMAGALVDHGRRRVESLRAADQDVVLGVWEMMFTASAADLDAMVDGVAAAVTAPYLSLHGIDPGPDYGVWLSSKLSGAEVEVWPDLGHYPHLVEPERFVQRVVDFDEALS